jgi:hypothetical protein
MPSGSDTPRVLYRGPLQHDERETPRGAKIPLALVLGPPILTPFGGPFISPLQVALAGRSPGQVARISFPLQMTPNLCSRARRVARIPPI